MSKVGHYAISIGSLIIIGVILYAVSYMLIVTVPQPWIALVLIIALFCCAIPMHNSIVTKLTSRKSNDVQ